MLVEAHDSSQIAPRAAARQMGEVAEELAALAADLESGFNDELVRQGLRSGSCCSLRRPNFSMR